MDKLIDTHRHLGGSVPIDFLFHAMNVGACDILPRKEIEKRMICLENEPKEFNNFLSKFRLLDKIKWTEELINQKIKLVCDAIEKENLIGMFLDFSVSKYRHIGWSLPEAISFILDRLDEHSKIPIVPILSIKYESPKEAQFKIAKIIEKSSIADKIGGIDFVGDESKFDPKTQKEICHIWQGKLVRAHVGESQSAANVITAIKEFKVTNIAHGIKIVHYEEMLKIAADSEVIFDIAPTSNYLTGVIAENEIHPGKEMHESGILLTIGSDDPIQCRTNLHNEYKIMADILTQEDINKIMDNAYNQLLKWKTCTVGRTKSLTD